MSKNTYEKMIRLRMAGHLDQALKLASQMVKKQKNQPLCWIELAGCYASKYDFTKAKLAIDKAMQLCKGQPLIYLNAANTMSACGFPSEAINILQRAIQLHPEDIHLMTELAACLERQNQTAEAEQMIDEVIDSYSKYAKALYLRAVILKRQDKPEQALEIIERLVSTTPAAQHTRDNLRDMHHLRIQCLDSLARYDEATGAFHETTAFIREFYSQEIETCQGVWQLRKQAMESMNQGVSSDLLKEWLHNAPSTDQSICFLSGHPRSGTTLVGTILSSHPDTVLVDEKEIFYRDIFIALLKKYPKQSSDVARLIDASEKHLSLCASRYNRLVEQCLGCPVQNQTIIDKHPLHIYSMPAAMRIFPQAQHLVVLRDPRAVALSCLLTNTELNAFSVNWIDPRTTAESYDQIMAGWNTLQSWNLPQVHTLQYETLVKSQKKQTQTIADQLGLAWDDSMLNYQQKAKSQAATSPTYAQVTRPIYDTSVEKWRHYENLLEPAMAMLEKTAKCVGY